MKNLIEVPQKRIAQKKDKIIQFPLFEINIWGWEEEWEGMPEFIQSNLMPIKTLKVHFKEQKDINAFSELIGQKITEKTRGVWYPKLEKKIQNNKRYSDES